MGRAFSPQFIGWAKTDVMDDDRGYFQPRTACTGNYDPNYSKESSMHRENSSRVRRQNPTNLGNKKILRLESQS